MRGLRVPGDPVAPCAGARRRRRGGGRLESSLCSLRAQRGMGMGAGGAGRGAAPPACGGALASHLLSPFLPYSAAPLQTVPVHPARRPPSPAGCGRVIDPSSDSADLPAGAVVEMPLWLIRALAARNMVQVRPAGSCAALCCAVLCCPLIAAARCTALPCWPCRAAALWACSRMHAAGEPPACSTHRAEQP